MLFPYFFSDAAMRRIAKSIKRIDGPAFAIVCCTRQA
jgi:hypothetical protein